jgi:hypothetical protein
MFYDVPCVGNITEPTYDPFGNRVGGKMLYVIFDCPFDAMSFASRNRNTYSLGNNLQVNRREWSERAWFNARIVDRRSKGI